MCRDQRPVPGPISHTTESGFKYGNSTSSNVGRGRRQPRRTLAQDFIAYLVTESAQHAVCAKLQNGAGARNTSKNARTVTRHDHVPGAMSVIRSSSDWSLLQRNAVGPGAGEILHT